MKQTWEACPVCHGRGEVQAGFYPSDPKRTECRTCSGKGALQTLDLSPKPFELAPYPVPVPYPMYPTYPWIGGVGKVTVASGTTVRKGYLLNDGTEYPAGG